jgi:cytoskeletal protein CcmA (bactofilin family)
MSGSGIFSARSTSDLAEELDEAARCNAGKLSAESTPDRAKEPKNAVPRGADKLTVVGAALQFKGVIVADGDLMIQGQIEGSIQQKASHLTIGSKGKVKADIHANHLIVQGEVVGDLYATEAVIVEASARVQGDIFAPRVTLKDGAQFRGSIDRSASGDTSIVRQPKVENLTPAVPSASKMTSENGRRKKVPL